MARHDEADGPDGAFFGRRKGKALRPHQGELITRSLPLLRLDPGIAPSAQFPAGTRDVHLEIGFGGGEHLAMRAAQAPDIGFIGCEVYLNGIAKMMAAIERGPLSNVRIWDEDAALLVDRLAAASIGRLSILYPDPWPKRRHRKRRFLGEAMLPRLARILRPGAELRFATDIDDYAAFVLARMARSPDFEWTATRSADWLTPWPGWRSTRYEAKALAAGRVPSYLTFRRLLSSS